MVPIVCMRVHGSRQYPTRDMHKQAAPLPLPPNLYTGETPQSQSKAADLEDMRRWTQPRILRRLLLASVLSAMLIPTLEYAIAASILVAVVAFGLSVYWCRRFELPHSLSILQVSAGMFTAGMVAFAVETTLNGGPKFPGFADALTIPAYLLSVWGLALAATARHALAKVADLFDAAAVAVTAITLTTAVSTAYLLLDSTTTLEVIVSSLYIVVGLAFLTVVLLLIFGPGTHTNGARFLAVTGLYAALFDKVLDTFTAVGQPDLADQSYRTVALPIVFYAIATSFDDYPTFATPGTRRQNQRSAVYGICFFIIALVVYAKPGATSFVGFIAFGAVVSVRLGISHTIVSRLQERNDVQRDLARRLADADDAKAVLEAGLRAVQRLVRPSIKVSIEGIFDESIVVGGELQGVTNEIRSIDELTRIRTDKQLRSHESHALMSIAESLSLATKAANARTARLTERIEADWRALSGANNELVFVVSAAGIVKKATPNARAILGSDPVGAELSDTIGQDLTPLLTGEVDELIFDDRAGHWFAVTSELGDRGSQVLTIHDVTARVAAEIIDPVTNLRNMRDLAKQPAFENTTVITYRLQDIHRISDLLGKEGTDKLLAQLAKRVTETTRVGIDRIWRGDGPTFIVACAGANMPHDGLRERLSKLNSIFTIDGQQIDPTIGAVVVPVSAMTTVETVLHRGDLTLNSRGTNKDGIVTFTEEIELKAHRRYRIEESLGAIRDDPATAGFRVHYQPITNAIDGQISRVEALLRWSHPTLGEISPVEFIPIAERNNKVEALDRFVLKQGCRDLTLFQAVSPDLHLQVNLSPVGLTPDRIKEMTQWIGQNCATPDQLTVEIIESAAGEEFDALIPSFEKLRAIGVGLSCDDYGVGESNIARLTRLPLTQVKLAGLFSTENIHPETISRLIDTIHSMGYDVVAESVETSAQADMLQVAGADLLQGWLISRDLAAPDLVNFLRTHAQDHTHN